MGTFVLECAMLKFSLFCVYMSVCSVCVWSECVVSVMAHTTSATGFPAEWHPNIACGNLYFFH